MKVNTKRLLFCTFLTLLFLIIASMPIFGTECTEANLESCTENSVQITTEQEVEATAEARWAGPRPSAPRNLGMGNLTPTTADLMWNLPSTGQPTGYQIEVMNEWHVTRIIDTISTSHIVTGLTSNLRHFVRVRATNGTTTGPWSCWYQFWTPPSRRQITLNANGGHVNPATLPRYEGSRYHTLPTPTHPRDYIFAGWFNHPTGGSHITVNSIVPRNDTTLWARWITPMEVFFDCHWWGDIVSVARVPHNTRMGDIALPIPANTPPGHRFVGWARQTNMSFFAHQNPDFRVTTTPMVWVAVWERILHPTVAISTPHSTSVQFTRNHTINVSGSATNAQRIEILVNGAVWDSINSNSINRNISITTTGTYNIRLRAVGTPGTTPAYSPTRTVFVNMPTNVWNCSTNLIGFWNTRVLSVWHNNATGFADHMTNAQNQWSAAVGGMAFTAGTHEEANILSYLQTRNQLIATANEYGLEYELRFAGLARHAAATEFAGTMVVAGRERTVLEKRPTTYYLLRPVMFVASNNQAGTATRTSAQILNTTLHELGHIMGYWGHSAHNTDVMFSSATTVTQLNVFEIAHIRQVYNRFRTQ